MRDKLYIPGLILISLAFIATVISFYLILFTVPVFVVGSVLVFISRKTIGVKVVTVVVPMLLWIPSTIIFLYLYNL